MNPKFRTYSTVYNLFFTQGEPDLETLQSFIYHYGDKDLEAYIGFKDKNGQDIFDGDICLALGHQIIICFKHGAFGYLLDQWGFIAFANNSSFHFDDENRCLEIEVIGNIHQGLKKHENTHYKTTLR